ncbi:MAG: DUF3489 domain-containing protein [Alphaproteobacteria bacterium]
MKKANPKKNAAEAATSKPLMTKMQRVVALLQREGGATVDELVNATGWQPHSARAALTGLRKKGFTLDRVRADGVTRYVVTAEPAA